MASNKSLTGSKVKLARFFKESHDGNTAHALCRGLQRMSARQARAELAIVKEARRALANNSR
jgi:hypothetical protein